MRHFIQMRQIKMQIILSVVLWISADQCSRFSFLHPLSFSSRIITSFLRLYLRFATVIALQGGFRSILYNYLQNIFSLEYSTGATNGAFEIVFKIYLRCKFMLRSFFSAFFSYSGFVAALSFVSFAQYVSYFRIFRLNSE